MGGPYGKHDTGFPPADKQTVSVKRGRYRALCDIAEAAGKVLWEAQAGEVTDGSLALLDAELARLETASEPDAAAPSVCSRCAGTDPGCYICAQFKSPDAAAKEPTDYLYVGCGCPQCRAETAGEEGT